MDFFPILREFFCVPDSDSPGRIASSMRLRLLKMMVFPYYSIPYDGGIYGDAMLSQ